MNDPIMQGKGDSPQVAQNQRHRILQVVPKPATGRAVYLDRTPLEIVNKSRDHLADFQLTIQALKQDFEQNGVEHQSQTLSVIGQVALECIDKIDEKGVLHEIKQLIEDGYFFTTALSEVRHTSYKKYVSSGVFDHDPFAEVLDNLENVYYEKIHGRKALKQILKELSEDTVLITEKIVPADGDLIKSHNLKQSTRQVVMTARLEGGHNDHMVSIFTQLGLDSVLVVDSDFDVSKIGNSSSVAILSEPGQGEGREMVLNPDSQLLDMVRGEARLYQRLHRELPLSLRAAVTRDGVKMKLLRSVRVESSLTACDSQVDIGMLSVETYFPTEILSSEDQTAAYLKMLRKNSPNVTTVRMPDFRIDGDKLKGDSVDALVLTNQAGEALSGSEVLLSNPDKLLLPNIRWLLSAIAIHGEGRILFPQVENAQHAQQLVDCVVQEKKNLKIEGHGHVEIGVMIESQRAANDIKAIVNTPGVDFISIGSNDYSSDVSTDSRYGRVKGGYSMCHHNVISGLYNLVSTVKEVNIERCKQGRSLIPISMCGRMASEPEFTGLVIGLEIDTLSIDGNIAEVNHAVSMTYASEARQMVRDIISHQMLPGEGVYNLFVKPFNSQLELPDHIAKML